MQKAASKHAADLHGDVCSDGIDMDDVDFFRKGHDGPCVNVGDCCSWMCDACEARRAVIRDDDASDDRNYISGLWGSR